MGRESLDAVEHLLRTDVGFYRMLMSCAMVMTSSAKSVAEKINNVQLVLW